MGGFSHDLPRRWVPCAFAVLGIMGKYLQAMGFAALWRVLVARTLEGLRRRSMNLRRTAREKPRANSRLNDWNRRMYLCVNRFGTRGQLAVAVLIFVACA